MSAECKKAGDPCEDAGLMGWMILWRQECRHSLFRSDRLLGVVLGGLLVAEPGAAGHFHAAFFVDSEALGGDDVAFFDDVFNVFGAAFGEFGDVDESVFAREHFP